MVFIVQFGGRNMEDLNNKYVGVETVIKELNISKPKAYEVIKEMNENMKEAYPYAIVIPGKVNRSWYDKCINLISK